jgi:hypothetical protein
MKNCVIVFSLGFAVLFSFVRADSDSYFLSSDSILQEKQGSLEGDKSFVFFSFVLTGKPQPQQVTKFIQEELKRVGIVIRHQVDTEKGMDMECFSNPGLQFTLKQLVDQDNRALPIIKAALDITSTVEIDRNHDSTSLLTNSWTVYLEKDKNVEKIVKKAFPLLLEKFIAAYKEANGKDAKPTFYIISD